MDYKHTRLYYIFRKMVLNTVRTVKPNFRKGPGKGGTNSARYCYSVFMRHMVTLFKNGMTNMPSRVAEFGPGNSLGMGFCAMLAGANEYYAFDIREYADTDKNLKIFDELVELFKKRAAIPDDTEIPTIPPLEDYSFPAHIFDEKVMEKKLSEERISLIRNVISAGFGVKDNVIIKYISPWENYKEEYPDVDFVFSQAVFEHVDNLEKLYSTMYKIVKAGGFVSHCIDFASHNYTYEWNGQWSVPARKWENGTNREPLSTHIRLFERHGFKIRNKQLYLGYGGKRPSIQRKKLVDKYVNLSKEDFETSACYVAAQK